MRNSHLKVYRVTLVKARAYRIGMARQKFFFLLLVLFCSFFTFSQTKNEEDLKKQAAKAFEEEDYAAGAKLFSTLLANYPKDAQYNYRMGVCLLYADPNKKKCLQYLEFATNHVKDAEKEAYFYLGKAYHLNFLFDDAIKFYNLYKQSGASSSMQKKLQVDHEMQCCKNGKRLLSNVRELVILDKKQVSLSDYFRSYDLKDIGGKLLAKPVDFISPNDKKKNDRSIVFLPRSKEVLYYASYGAGENKDIYMVKRLPSGDWGKAENLKTPINTEYDEDFPFLHPNGKVLYFASKGHNSMGGYDVFKSDLDESTGMWKEPVNLDFPINSPDDDILFVTDSLEKIAFLSSSRQSLIGKIDVYKILTERRPAEYAYIKGTVIKKDAGQSVKAKIKVKNIDNGEDAGTFSADDKGEYAIKIGNGGKYIFTVETPGFTTQSEGVTVPVAYTYKPYRQTIEYENQKLKITNFFETNDNDENNYAQYIALLEEKSKMNVNAADFDINPNNPVTTTPVTTNTAGTTEPKNTTEPIATNTASTNPGKTNHNNAELVKMAYDDAKEYQQSADSLKKDAAVAFSAANSKQDQANEKKQEAADLRAKADAETNPSKKQELTAEAEKTKDEADLYSAQATTANNIAKQMEVDAVNKQKEADLNAQYAKALEEAEKTKNNKQAIAKLEELQKQLEAAANQKSGTNNLVESIKADAQNKEKELQGAEAKQKKIDDIIDEFNKQYADLDKQEKETRDKDLVQNIKAQKEEVTADLNEKQKESQINKNKIAVLKDEADALRSQADYASNVLSGTAATNTTTASVASNTVAATNTVTTSPTNTVVETNTVSANENPPGSFAADSKKFEEDLLALNNAGNKLDNNKKKEEVLKQYTIATDKEIKDKKDALKKAKTAAEKTALNNEIKQLTQKKTELEKENTVVSNQVKEQEKQAALAVNDAGKDTTGKTVVTNTTSVATTTVVTTPTETTNAVATNTATTNPEVKEDPRAKDLNQLLDQASNGLNEEKKTFSEISYSDPKAQQLKKQAEDKLSAVQKTNTELEQQLKTLKAQLSEPGSSQKTIEKATADIKIRLAKERQAGNNALKLLIDANKAEYATVMSAFLAAEKQTGSNYDAQELRSKAELADKDATLTISKIASAKDDEQKRDLYLGANTKLEEAIGLARKAKDALTAEIAVETETVTPTNTNTVEPVVTNTIAPVTTNTTAVATNTIEAVNTNTVAPVNSNTVTAVETNTVEPVITNTVEPVSTNTIEPVTTNTVEPVNSNTVAAVTTNTVTPGTSGTLTETQLAEIKNSEEYQKVTSLKSNINKYSDAANNDAEKAQEENMKYERLNKEAAAMPAGAAKQKKEQEALFAKIKADSLSEMASNTRALANSKKQELEDYSQTLDKTTLGNIEIASTQTVASAPAQKYEDYSPSYQKNTSDLDKQLASLREQSGTPENLTKQDELITSYITNIETEVAEKKKQQAASTDPGEKNKLAQQIKTLQLQKIKLNNERTTNENTIRSASGNVNPVVNNNPPVKTNDGLPASVSNYLITNGFEIKKGNAYSAANPIPVNEKLPDGLFFRVQIGAFKNPIPQDRFSGLAPVGAETTPFGFVRYQVGMFNKYQAAVAVRNDLKKLKYNDAFVVAYRNGKRIPLGEALDTLRKTGEDITPNANSTAGITVNSNIPVNPEATVSNVAPVKTDGELNTMNGAFYTIQIGVYGNNVSAAGLLNLSPVFKEALSTGYNRYTAGIYSNFEKVNADRARVNTLGIPDAFVSGYINGKRVKFNEALDNSGGNLQFLPERPIIFAGAGQNTAANTGTATAVNTTTTNVQPFNNGVKEGPVPTAENGVKTDETGVTFKVQIGAYRNQVPANIADTWLKVKTWPIKYTQVNDLFIYTVGSFSEARFAKTLKAEVVSLGITDAFVAVFKDGKKLYGAEAAQYLNR